MSDNTENKTPVNAADTMNTVPETASPEQTTSEKVVASETEQTPEVPSTVTVTLDGVLRGTFSASGGTNLKDFPGITMQGYTFRDPNNSNREVGADRQITANISLVTAARGSGG